jgi:hypothetical protein
MAFAFRIVVVVAMHHHHTAPPRSNRTYHARAELNVITMITFLVSTTATSLDGPKHSIRSARSHRHPPTTSTTKLRTQSTLTHTVAHMTMHVHTYQLSLSFFKGV